MAETKIDAGLITLPSVANILDNGGFEVWQRGAGPFTVTGHCADRWRLQKGVGETVQVDRESGVGNVFSGDYSLKFTRSVIGSAWSGIWQNIENYKVFRGKTVTFSCMVKTSVANAIQLRLYGVNGNFHSGSGNWEMLSVTQTLPVDIVELSAYIWTRDAGQGSTGVFYIDNAMLVFGPTPVDYVPESPAIEMLRCQRHYEKFETYDVLPMINQASGVQTTIMARPIVKKAATPTVTGSGVYVTLWYRPSQNTPGYTDDSANWSVSASSTNAANTQVFYSFNRATSQIVRDFGIFDCFFSLEVT